MTKLYWHYATITIRRGSEIHRAYDYAPRTLPMDLVVRARRRVTRQDEPAPGSAWVFNYCDYAYYLPLATELLAATDEHTTATAKPKTT